MGKFSLFVAIANICSCVVMFEAGTQAVAPVLEVVKELELGAVGGSKLETLLWRDLVLRKTTVFDLVRQQ